MLPGGQQRLLGRIIGRRGGVLEMLGSPENGPEWWVREAGSCVAYAGNGGNTPCAEPVREWAGRPCITASFTWVRCQRNTATPKAFRAIVISTAGFLQRPCRGCPLCIS